MWLKLLGEKLRCVGGKVKKDKNVRMCKKETFKKFNFFAVVDFEERKKVK